MEYRVVTNFVVGSIGETLSKDENVYFDGVTLNWRGSDYKTPELKKVLGKLLVPVSDQQTSYRPQPALVQVAPEVGDPPRTLAPMQTVAQEEERHVRKVALRSEERERKAALTKEDAEAINRAAIEEALSIPVVKYSGQAGNLVTPTTASIKGGSSSQFGLVSADGDAKPVKVLPPPEGDVYVGSEALRAATSRAPKEARVEVSFSGESFAEVGVNPSHASNKASGYAVFGQDTENFTVVSGRAKLQADPKVGSVPVDDLSMVAETVPVQPRSREVSAEVVIENPYHIPNPVQVILDTWDTKRPWQYRVAEAVDYYSDQPEILEAIFKKETVGVVKQIKEKLNLSV